MLAVVILKDCPIYANEEAMNFRTVKAKDGPAMFLRRRL
jgi:hypothetical protein